MRKTIGIFAHVDAGKTTFCEQILYHTGSIRKKGRVDHRDAFFDNNKIERERGITVFSEVGRFTYRDSEYYLIDTPGHVDFSSEMERSISVLDYAVIIVSAVEGVQGHTETVWNLLKAYKVPCFFFINKTDRDGADVEGVLDEIRNNLSKDIIMIEDSGIIKELPESVIEFAAEHDEMLLEKYLEGQYDEEIWKSLILRMIRSSSISFVMKGSALLDKGIKDFLTVFDEFTRTDYKAEGSQLKARVYKIKHDEKGVRLTYLKILSGTISVKDEVLYPYKDGSLTEKINEIRIYSGDKYQTSTMGVAGQIVAVTGLTEMRSGMGINIPKLEGHIIVPTLRAKVIFSEELNPKQVLIYFKILESENDSLNVTYSEELKEIHISIMGVIELEVLKEEVKDRFGIDIEFGKPEILYKETIKNSVDAFGHFEPLRHYAEVYFRMEEGDRGSGITFENRCHPDDLSTGNQNLIKTHIFERDHKGILTGSPITDIKIVLVTGRAHLKHTEGGDFREAVKRAIRQGLEQAENVLLEPYYKFKIDINIDLMGRVISDIQRMACRFLPPKTYGDRVIIEGTGPVSTLMNYPIEFQAFTKGKGALSFKFCGYNECHNSQDVIESIAYKKDADPEYTSSSIFCSKGSGYSVPWYEVRSHAHCIK